MLRIYKTDNVKIEQIRMDKVQMVHSWDSDERFQLNIVSIFLTMNKIYQLGHEIPGAKDLLNICIRVSGDHFPLISNFSSKIIELFDFLSSIDLNLSLLIQEESARKALASIAFVKGLYYRRNC